MPRFSKRKRQSLEAARAPRSQRRALPPAEPPATATALNVDVEASPVTPPPDAATPLTPTPPPPPLAQDDLHAN